jgi:hypothetical protein
MEHDVLSVESKIFGQNDLITVSYCANRSDGNRSSREDNDVSDRNVKALLILLVSEIVDMVLLNSSH